MSKKVAQSSQKAVQNKSHAVAQGAASRVQGAYPSTVYARGVSENR